MPRGEERYQSILHLKLQSERDRNAQERQEALAREQMNDQMEMKALDQIVKSGQVYFNAMKAADDRELAFAQMQHKQQLAREKEARDKQKHDMEQIQKWKELQLKEGVKVGLQEDAQKEAREQEDRAYDLGRKRKPWEYWQELGLRRGGASRTTISTGSTGLTPNQEAAEKNRLRGGIDDYIKNVKGTLDANVKNIKDAIEKRKFKKHYKSSDYGEDMRVLKGLETQINNIIGEVHEAQSGTLESFSAAMAKKIGEIRELQKRYPQYFDPNRIGGAVQQQSIPTQGVPQQGATSKQKASGWYETMKNRQAGGGGQAPSQPTGAQQPITIQEFTRNSGPPSPDDIQQYYFFLQDNYGTEAANQMMVSQGLQ